MSIWPRTPCQEKQIVRAMIVEMLQDMGLTWSDLHSKARCPELVEARSRAAVIAFEYLRPWMSEARIVDWYGGARSTFKSCRVRWNTLNGEKQA